MGIVPMASVRDWALGGMRGGPCRLLRSGMRVWEHQSRVGANMLAMNTAMVTQCLKMAASANATIRAGAIGVRWQ